MRGSYKQFSYKLFKEHDNKARTKAISKANVDFEVKGKT